MELGRNEIVNVNQFSEENLLTCERNRESEKKKKMDKI